MELEGKTIVPIALNNDEIEISWNETKKVNKQELINQIEATEKHLNEMKALLEEF